MIYFLKLFLNITSYQSKIKIHKITENIIFNLYNSSRKKYLRNIVEVAYK